MKQIKLVFRKSSKIFNSIENVFNSLLPYLKVKKELLPFHSNGLVPRLKNIYYLVKSKNGLIHITGHDHYLLWWPFKNAILTIHDIEALRRKRSWRRWFFKLFWFDIPIKNAKFVTTISEFSKNEILSLGNYKTPIVVIYNPVTLPLVFSSKIFNIKEPRILHLGTKRNKNLVRTIKALQGVNCHLTIIGKTDIEIINLLKVNLIQYSVKSNLTTQEIIEEYINCDIVSFVSTYEGFGLPIIEAQSIGRAVMTSNTASMPEVAGKGALFVDPFSIKEIKEGMLKLVNDAELRETLITQGLINVKRFDVSTIAHQYTKLYNSILND